MTLRRVLAGEAVKATTTPVTYGFFAAILALTALNTSLSLTDVETHVETAAGVRHVFAASRDFLVLFIALGAVAAAGEFRHGTAVPTFLTTPVRRRVLGAKIAVHAGAGALIALACVIAQMLVALPYVAGQGGPGAPWSPDVLEPALGNIFCGGAYCGLGVAVGLLLRNQVVALIATLAWFAVAESALAQFAPSLSRYLPGGLFSGSDQHVANLLPLPLAAIVLACYIGAISVTALGTTLRRDIA